MYASVYKIEKDSGKGMVPLTLVANCNTQKEVNAARERALSLGASQVNVYEPNGNLKNIVKRGGK